MKLFTVSIAMVYIILCIGETLCATPAQALTFTLTRTEKLMCLHFAQHTGDEKK